MLRRRNKAKADDVGALTPEMEEVLAQGDEIAKTPRQVTLSLKSCRVHGNQEEKWHSFSDAPAEVYVAALAVDLSGTARNLEGANDVFKNVKQHDSKSISVSVSPPFKNVWDGDELPLFGGGIQLYGPLDPKGLLDVHILIMEDDGGYRKLGKIIEDAAKKIDLGGITEAAASAAGLSEPRVAAAKKAVTALAEMVSVALGANDDDVIQTIHWSALAHQGYLPGPLPFNYSAREGSAAGLITVDVQPKPW